MDFETLKPLFLVLFGITGYDQNNGRRNTGIDQNTGKNGYDEEFYLVNKAVRNNGIDQITGKITYDGFIPLFQW